MFKYKAAFSLLILNSLLVCAVLLCSGTSLAQLLTRQNPDNTPNRIVTIKSDDQAELKGFLVGAYHAPNEGLCIAVQQDHFWQPGIKPRLLQTTLIHNLKVYLSEHPIPRRLMQISSGLVGEFLLTDAQGNVIGSYSAPFTACFSTQLLPVGCYNSLLHETGVSGDVEEYAFRICIQKPNKQKS